MTDPPSRSESMIAGMALIVTRSLWPDADYSEEGRARSRELRESASRERARDEMRFAEYDQFDEK